MKKITRFLLATLISAPLTTKSQPFDYNASHFYIDKLKYSNTEGENGVTNYINRPGRIIYKAVWENTDTKRYSENYFKYQHGNLVEVFRIFSDSISSVKTFDYDSTQRLTKETYNRSDGVVGTASYYYENKKNTKLVCEKQNGWLTATINYQYNKDGQRESAIIYQKEKKIGSIAFTYSGKNLTEEKWDFNGKYAQTFIYHYIDKRKTNFANTNPLINLPPGTKIKNEHYTYNNDIGGPSFFTYDEAGKLIKKRFVRSDSVETNTTYIYKNDFLHKAIRKYSNGSHAEFSLHYDEFGQITKKSYVKSDGTKGQETFLYNINGKLIAARYDNMDSWLTGTIVFKHNKYDQIISGKFQADSGFTANILFENNDKGLPKSITWNFSFGDFQKYTFVYE